MARLLIHETSYRRLRPDLDALPGLESVLIAGDGALSVDGEAVSPDEARPDIAWANGDVFFSPVAGREFMITALKSPALKWTQSGAAGFDHPIFAQLVGKGVRLTTSHGQAIGMAGTISSMDRSEGRPRLAASGSVSAFAKSWVRIG